MRQQLTGERMKKETEDKTVGILEVVARYGEGKGEEERE